MIQSMYVIQRNVYCYKLQGLMMPFMTNGKRDYKKELEWENERARHRLKDRVMRHAARREVEKSTGNLPSSKHVDHKKPLVAGGSNSKSNLQVVSAKSNLAKEGRRKAGK